MAAKFATAIIDELTKHNTKFVNDTLAKTIGRFIEKISADKDLDREELTSLWEELSDIPLEKEVPETKSKPTKTAKDSSSSGTCTAIVKKSGLPCGLKIKTEVSKKFCGRHLKNESKDDDEEEKPAKKTVKKTEKKKTKKEESDNDDEEEEKPKEKKVEKKAEKKADKKTKKEESDDDDEEKPKVEKKADKKSIEKVEKKAEKKSAEKVEKPEKKTVEKKADKKSAEKTEKKKEVKKEVKKQASSDDDDDEEEDSKPKPKPIAELVMPTKDEFGRYVHKDSGFVFDKETTAVIGKCGDGGEIRPLSEEDITKAKSLKFTIGSSKKEAPKAVPKKEAAKKEAPKVAKEESDNNEGKSKAPKKPVISNDSGDDSD